MVVEREWLYVVCATATCGSIAHMADGNTTAELRELLLVEDLGNKTLTLDSIELIAIKCRDTTSLLTTVLQSVQTIVSQVWGIVYAKNTKHTALLVQVIAIYI
jgi:hypothetical protein